MALRRALLTLSRGGARGAALHLGLTGTVASAPEMPVASAGLLQLLRGAKTQSSEVRSGNVLEINGKLYQVTKQEYTQGRGRQLGNVHLELKDLLSGSQRLEKLRPADTVEKVRLDERQFDFLYREGDMWCFMDPESFEQISLGEETLGEATRFITVDTPVKLAFHQGQPITASVPSMATLAVESFSPVGGGDKLAIVETGFTLKVPNYVSEGDKIVVDTATSKFVKRA
mmetsp:Transcript_45114/g.114207  ORF Transcript_45114/g.114207 Transcript_45114/m.114207 type:complete len:229 (+) Transcript_45114:135-821(+)|eukprot:jgi/Tetstr1/426638/TSEL_016915.t1